MAETMYLVTYCEEDWYEKFHDDKEKERKIDKLFSYADYICYLKQTKNISEKEFEIFKYTVHRICISPYSQKYLSNLYFFSKKNNVPCSFQHLIDYGIKNTILLSDFKENTNLYEKTINW